MTDTIIGRPTVDGEGGDGPDGNDTGWRLLDSAPDPIIGRRVGNLVMLVFDPALNWSTWNWAAASIPAGFRPAQHAMAVLCAEGTSIILIVDKDTGSCAFGAGDGTYGNGHATYLTDDNWPAVLPDPFEL